MIVEVIGRNYINKIILPKAIEGNNYIQDIEINIDAKDGKWELTSEQSKIISPNSIHILNDKITFNSQKIKILNKVNNTI